MDVVTTRFIAVLITVVWSVSTLAAIFIHGYQPPVELHAIMGVLAGSVFGKTAVTRMRNGNGNGG